MMRSRLKVTTNRDSWVMQASLRDEDPARAERGLKGVLDNYLALQAERQAHRSNGAVSFLGDQVRLGRARPAADRRPQVGHPERRGHAPAQIRLVEPPLLHRQVEQAVQPGRHRPR